MNSATVGLFSWKYSSMSFSESDAASALKSTSSSTIFILQSKKALMSRQLFHSIASSSKA